MELMITLFREDGTGSDGADLNLKREHLDLPPDELWQTILKPAFAALIKANKG